MRTDKPILMAAPEMKLKRTKSESTRAAVIDSPQDARFANSPSLAALVAKMTSALEARKRKTSWTTDEVRAEMLHRYADMLDDADETALRGFVRWVVEDARYLLAEGNFEMFCHLYLMAELGEAPALWEMAGDAPH